MPQNTQIQVRRSVSGPSTITGTWAQVNPVLAEGEIGFETDTGKFKIGNGATAWNSLTYATDGSKLTGTINSSTAVNLSGTQTANTVYAAPNGSSGTASFRALVASDVPTLNQSTTGTAKTITDTTLPSVTLVNNTAIPASSTLVTSSLYRQSQNTTSGSVDIFPRMMVTTTRSLGNGIIYLTAFTPLADITVTSITSVITSTTGTSMQYGLFTVSGQTVTSLGGTTTGTPAAGAFTLSFATGITLTAGTSYMIGFLAIGGATTIVGASTYSTGDPALIFQGNFTGTVIGPMLTARSNSSTVSSIPSNGTALSLLAGTAQTAIGWARLN